MILRTARLAYEVNDNFNVYGSYATGFKSSSWNLTRDTRPFLADAAALQAAGILPNNYVPSTGRNFGTRFAAPEEAEVFELGLKARFDIKQLRTSSLQSSKAQVLFFLMRVHSRPKVSNLTRHLIR